MARSPLTLREAVAEFIELKTAGRAEGTAESYRLTMGHMLRGIDPDLGVRSLTAKHFERYLLTGKNNRHGLLAPSTFNKERAILQTFCGFLVRRGYVQLDLMGEVRPVKYQKPPKLRLTAAQLSVALECQVHPRDRMTMALVMNTGLRASDLAQIQIGYIDLPRGEFTVTLKKTGLHEVLPITQELDAELRAWIVWYQAFMKVSRLEDEWYLLPLKAKPAMRGFHDRHHFDVLSVQMFPERPAQYQSLLRPVKTALAAMDLPASGQGLHTIRRSVARLYYDFLIAQGSEARDQALRMVQVLLGHSSVKTTELYIGLDVERDMRNKSLRGRSFLGAMMPSTENVVPLRAVDGG